jgi:hypothetical protein
MKISVKERMAKAVEALNSRNWGPGQVDARPECHEDWTHDYAVIQIEAEAWDPNPYFDYDHFHQDIVDVIKETLGRSFTVIGQDHGKLKAGKLYLQFHGRYTEVEAYRYKNPKKPRKSK